MPSEKAQHAAVPGRGRNFWEGAGREQGPGSACWGSLLPPLPKSKTDGALGGCSSSILKGSREAAEEAWGGWTRLLLRLQERAPWLLSDVASPLSRPPETDSGPVRFYFTPHLPVSLVTTGAGCRQLWCTCS